MLARVMQANEHYRPSASEALSHPSRWEQNRACGVAPGLGFGLARANLLAAARAATAVFCLQRCREVDVVDVGQRNEPRQHIGEFAGQVLPRAFA